MTPEENNDTPPAGAEEDPSKPRRAYSAPRLIVYGDARELTQAVGSKGKKDGSGNRKTGF